MSVMHYLNVLFLVSFISTAALAQNAARPNFLIIMADDLGYGDLSCHGGKTPTPNIDKLINQGIEFGNFMTCPVCSPTRAGLLTGLNPLRTGQGPNTDGQLATNIPTMGSVFQQNGYKTGLFGKWHNGNAPEFYPTLPHVNDYGFDRFVGFYGGGCDYYTKVWANKPTSPNWYHNKTEINTEFEYSTDLLTRYTLEFIEQNKTNQFLAYVPLNIIHTPLHVKDIDLQRVPASILQTTGGPLRTWKEYYKLYNDGDTPEMNTMYAQLTGDNTIFSIAGTLSATERQVLYSAMLINLDDKVGEMMKYLEDNKLANNTVVLFFSDNGATPDGSGLPFSGNKHSTLEGGVHSPAVIRWPAGGLTGTKTFKPMVGYLDVLPTFMEIAGISTNATGEIDGSSFLHEMKTGAETGNREYYWLWRDHDVIRTDQWKMSRYIDRVELFDIKKDITESTNVQADNPAVTTDLKAKLEKWRESAGVAITHLAPKLATTINPAPENAALKVIADFATDASNPELIIQISGTGYKLLPDDNLHFDIKVEPGSKTDGFYVTPFFGTGKYFNAKRGVDQFGRNQITAPAPLGGAGVWEHRVIGLGSEAPGVINKFSIILKKTGKFNFYIDNLQIRRGDGSVLDVWSNSTKVSAVNPLYTISTNSNFTLSAFYQQGITSAESISAGNQINVSYSSNGLEIVSSSKNIDHCTVYSADGKLVAQSESRSKTCMFGSNSFNPGFYIVSATIGGRVFNQKVVIRNY